MWMTGSDRPEQAHISPYRNFDEPGENIDMISKKILSEKHMCDRK
jgi:hypothetical protein